jgi:hypothetical protein
MKNIIISICLLFLLTGCGPRLVYPHLDWLIPFYVNDYISLNREQDSMLEKRLLQVLDWHCRTQLPAYAQSLRALAQDLDNPSQPFSYQKFEYYSDQFLAHWRELLKNIGPELADILATASDEQIAELFRNLERRIIEYKSEYVDISLEKLEKKRKARMAKDLGHWVSRLKKEQTQMASDWSDQILPMAADGLSFREAALTEFQNLFAGRRQNPHFKVTFVSLLDNLDQLRAPEYQQKIDYNTDLTFKLLMGIERSLSTTQRKYLLQKIFSLAADFDKLSCDPVQIKPEQE